MKRSLYVAVTSALFVTLATLAGAETTTTQSSSTTTTTTKAAPASEEVTLPGGTKYVDEVVGTGPEAKAGKTVTVHYTGKLTNGTKFDSSKDHGQPFRFPLGGGQVIAGWDNGVAGMKVGGKRKLTIPADQGYGSRDMGKIPPNSTLLFDVELLGVQ
ncbi:MAG: FKBP-type peptidyl-prolyl cis-trans isomerase [Candidatus Sumerlaeaceae bacterium]